MLIRKLSRKFSRGRSESSARQAEPIPPPTELSGAPVTKSGWLKRHVPPKFVGKKRWTPCFVTLRSHFLTVARSGGEGRGIDQWFDLRGATIMVDPARSAAGARGSTRTKLTTTAGVAVPPALSDGEHAGCVFALLCRTPATAAAAMTELVLRADTGGGARAWCEYLRSAVVIDRALDAAHAHSEHGHEQREQFTNLDTGESRVLDVTYVDDPAMAMAGILRDSSGETAFDTFGGVASGQRRVEGRDSSHRAGSNGPAKGRCAYVGPSGPCRRWAVREPGRRFCCGHRHYEQSPPSYNGGSSDSSGHGPSSVSQRHNLPLMRVHDGKASLAATGPDQAPGPIMRSAHRREINQCFVEIRGVLGRYTESEAEFNNACLLGVINSGEGALPLHRQAHAVVHQIVVNDDIRGYENLCAVARAAQDAFPTVDEHGQRVRACTQAVSDLATLHDEARHVLPLFTRCIKAIAARYRPARQHKDESAGLQLHVARVKGLYRVMEKMCLKADKRRYEASKICDMVRCLFECDSCDVMASVLNDVRADADIEIVRVKDRINNPERVIGWRDVMVNFRLRSDTFKHVCELQIAHKKMLAVREDIGGHDAYEDIRTAREILQVRGIDIASIAPADADQSATALAAFTIPKEHPDLQPVRARLDALDEALRADALDARAWQCLPCIVPERITPANGEEVRQRMRSMIRTSDIRAYYPEVLITYATGPRPGLDAEGTGPGMYYALWLAQMLAQACVPSFSGLCVGGGLNWKMFLDKLGGPQSRCKWLIVVQTKALYSSRPCLEEIFTATQNGVRVLPVLFEGDALQAKQWPKIGASDIAGTEWRHVVRRSFGRLNSVPSPPATVLTQPHAWHELMADIVATTTDGEDQRAGTWLSRTTELITDEIHTLTASMDDSSADTSGPDSNAARRLQSGIAHLRVAIRGMECSANKAAEVEGNVDSSKQEFELQAAIEDLRAARAATGSDALQVRVNVERTYRSLALALFASGCSALRARASERARQLFSEAISIQPGLHDDRRDEARRYHAYAWYAVGKEQFHCCRFNDAERTLEELLDPNTEASRWLGPEYCSKAQAYLDDCDAEHGIRAVKTVEEWLEMHRFTGKQPVLQFVEEEELELVQDFVDIDNFDHKTRAVEQQLKGVTRKRFVRAIEQLRRFFNKKTQLTYIVPQTLAVSTETKSVFKPPKAHNDGTLTVIMQSPEATALALVLEASALDGMPSSSFVNKFQADVSHAAGISRSRVRVLNTQCEPHSVVVSFAITPNLCSSAGEPSAANAAQTLIKQASDPKSTLCAGNVTGKLLRLKTATLIATTSLVAEHGPPPEHDVGQDIEIWRFGEDVVSCTVVAELGRGAQATVYRVECEGVARALKVARVVPISEEARVMLRVNSPKRHPNVLTVSYVCSPVDSRDEILFLEELVDGQTLASLIESGDLYNDENASWSSSENDAALVMRLINIFMQLLGALIHIHACAVLHQDIKPENIMLNPHTWRLTLIDFGVASIGDVDEQGHLRAQIKGGTLAYCSRMQRDLQLLIGSTRDDKRRRQLLHDNALTQHADIWGAAIVCLEMFCGGCSWRGRHACADAWQMLGASIAGLDAKFMRVPFPAPLGAALEQCLNNDKITAIGAAQICAGAHPMVDSMARQPVIPKSTAGLSPTLAGAMYANLGLALHERGKSIRAEACYRDALEVDRHDVRTMNNLGVLLAARDEMEEAARLFGEANTLDANHQEANANLSHLHDAKWQFVLDHRAGAASAFDSQSGALLHGASEYPPPVRYAAGQCLSLSLDQRAGRRRVCYGPFVQRTVYEGGNLDGVHNLKHTRMDQAASDQSQESRLSALSLVPHEVLPCIVPRVRCFSNALRTDWKDGTVESLSLTIRATLDHIHGSSAQNIAFSATDAMILCRHISNLCSSIGVHVQMHRVPHRHQHVSAAAAAVRSAIVRSPESFTSILEQHPQLPSLCAELFATDEHENSDSTSDGIVWFMVHRNGSNVNHRWIRDQAEKQHIILQAHADSQSGSIAFMRVELLLDPFTVRFDTCTMPAVAPTAVHDAHFEYCVPAPYFHYECKQMIRIFVTDVEDSKMAGWRQARIISRHGVRYAVRWDRDEVMQLVDLNEANHARVLLTAPQLDRERVRYRRGLQEQYGHFIDAFSGGSLNLLTQTASLQLKLGSSRAQLLRNVQDFENINESIQARRRKGSDLSELQNDVEDASMLLERVLRPVEANKYAEGHFGGQPCALILGPAASGKTTLLRRFVIDALEADGDFVPVLVGVVDLVRKFEEFTENFGPVHGGHHGMTHAILYQKAGGEEAQFRFLLQAFLERRVLFLIDGMDEAGLCRGELETFVAQHLLGRGHRVVLTSRESGFSSELEAAFCDEPTGDVVQLLPLSILQQKHMIEARLSAQSAQTFMEHAHGKKLDELAENPLMLTMLVSVFNGMGGKLPEKRTELYTLALRAMIDRTDAVHKGAQAMDRSRLDTFLRTLALKSHCRIGQFRVFCHRDIVHWKIEQEWAEVCKMIHSGTIPIIVSLGLNANDEEEFRFSHLTFQEYYVALEIVRTFSVGKQITLGNGPEYEVMLEDSRWHVVLQMCLEFLDNDLISKFSQAVLMGDRAKAHLSLGPGLGGPGMRVLAPLLAADKSVRSLDLSRAALAGSTPIDDLADALSTNIALTTLDLRQCSSLVSAGKLILAQALETNVSTKLRHFSCDDWCIAEGMAEVDLRNHKLVSIDARLISNILLRNNTVTSLHLGSNSIGPAGVQHIASMMAQNKVLQHVDLSSNGVGLPEGWSCARWSNGVFRHYEHADGRVRAVRSSNDSGHNRRRVPMSFSDYSFDSAMEGEPNLSDEEVAEALDDAPAATTLRVSNLGAIDAGERVEAFLRREFGRFGNIQRIYLANTQHSLDRSVAFVTFHSGTSAARVIQALTKPNSNVGRLAQLSVTWVKSGGEHKNAGLEARRWQGPKRKRDCTLNTAQLDDWVCSKCGISNYSSHVACYNCQSNRNRNELTNALEGTTHSLEDDFNMPHQWLWRDKQKPPVRYVAYRPEINDQIELAYKLWKHGAGPSNIQVAIRKGAGNNDPAHPPASSRLLEAVQQKTDKQPGSDEADVLEFTRLDELVQRAKKMQATVVVDQGGNTIGELIDEMGLSTLLPPGSQERIQIGILVHNELGLKPGDRPKRRTPGWARSDKRTAAAVYRQEEVPVVERRIRQVAAQVESTRSVPHKFPRIGATGASWYAIDFTQMEQRNVVTGYTRRVCRKPMSSQQLTATAMARDEDDRYGANLGGQDGKLSGSTALEYHETLAMTLSRRPCGPGTAAICAVLASHPSLTVVNLLKNDLSGGVTDLLDAAEKAAAVGTLLQSLCGIAPEQTRADFSHQGLQETDAELLAAEILRNRKITSLNFLSNGGIGVRGATMILKACEQRRDSADSDEASGSGGALQTILGLNAPCNDKAEFDQRGWGDTDGLLLAAELTINRALRVCDVRGNGFNYANVPLARAVLQHKGLKNFCDIPCGYLRADTITKVSLADHFVGVCGAVVLAGYIQTNWALKSVDLTNNAIGLVGATHIAEALPHAKALSSLALGHNEIGDDGAQALCRALKHNSTLTELDINSYHSTVKIGAAGAQAIANMLRVNTTLKTLNVAANNLGVPDGWMRAVDNWGGFRGYMHIGQSQHSAASTPSAPAGLQNERPDAPSPGIRALGQALRANNTLQSINLLRNDIADGADVIVHAFARNTNLKTLCGSFALDAQPQSDYRSSNLKHADALFYMAELEVARGTGVSDEFKHIDAERLMQLIPPGALNIDPQVLNNASWHAGTTSSAARRQKRKDRGRGPRLRRTVNDEADANISAMPGLQRCLNRLNALAGGSLVFMRGHRRVRVRTRAAHKAVNGSSIQETRDNLWRSASEEARSDKWQQLRRKKERKRQQRARSRERMCAWEQPYYQ